MSGREKIQRPERADCGSLAPSKAADRARQNQTLRVRSSCDYYNLAAQLRKYSLFIEDPSLSS